MRTDREAADLARKVANILNCPNQYMQDKISDIRGMIGTILALKENHRIRLCLHMAGMFIKNEKTQEAMIGFLAGCLHDLYVNPIVDESIMLQFFPDLKKLFTSNPVEALNKIIAETSDKE